MRTPLLSVNLLLSTVMALVTAYYAVFSISLGGIHSANWTDAELIRHRCPIRLIQPEWVSSHPDTLLNWLQAESIARLGFIATLWLGGVGILLRQHQKRRKNTHGA